MGRCICGFQRPRKIVRGPRGSNFPPGCPNSEPLPKRFFSRINPKDPTCKDHLRINRMKRFSHLLGRLVHVAQQLITETVEIGRNARNQECRVRVIAPLYRPPNSLYFLPIHTQSHPAPQDSFNLPFCVGYLSDAPLANFANFVRECGMWEEENHVTTFFTETYSISPFSSIPLVTFLHRIDH